MRSQLVAAIAAGTFAAFVVCAHNARAQPASADGPSSSDAGSAAAPVQVRPSGVAVLAAAPAVSPSVDADAGAGSAAPSPSASAWPLAKAVYGKPALRPRGVDEAHARVLAGESPAPDAPKELKDLAETRAAIHGDDAPSRQLLASIATTFHLRGIVVVMTSAGAAPQARVFVADTGTFDAARYAPDGAVAGDVDWTGAVASLDRAYGEGPQIPQVSPSRSTMSAPALATQPLPKENKEKDAPSRPFYASPWFWGAIGAAALGGTALYFATRDNTPSTIHLQMSVPK